MNFKHIIIDPEPPGIENDICLIADVNNDGFNDIIIGGKQGKGNLVWYKYPEWKRHTIGTANLEAGGAVIDITKNGYLDLVAGQPWGPQGGPELYWFENPGNPEKEWIKRIICNDLNKYHDQVIGDIDNDEEKEIIFASQQAQVLAYYDIPSDPYQSPWPKECRKIIATEIVVEALVVADIDNDGRNELIAGPNIFKFEGNTWRRFLLDPSFQLTRVAVGDINQDGLLEIIISEGESYPARLAWFTAFPECRLNVINDQLFHPHSLAVADFTGNGTLDIMVGEMGLGKNPEPKLMIYLNQGDAHFQEYIIAKNCPTHEAKAGIIGPSGRVSIVGKPYYPQNQVDLWLNQG